jgi:hypothetical protein
MPTKSKQPGKSRPARATKTPQQVAELFLQALTELYPLDKTAPGVVLAWVKDKGAYYASAVRYEGLMGDGKQVLASAFGKTVEDALNILAQNWYSGVGKATELRRYARRLPEHNQNF